MIMNKILVIAVAAVVVAGGVGAAVFFMNQGKSDDFSFKDCHFDLSGAKSLVIAKDSAGKFYLEHGKQELRRRCRRRNIIVR